MIFRKNAQDNFFIIQQIVNETDFAARKTVVVQCFARLSRILATYDYRRISVRMTDSNDFLTIYGHRANLLNNNMLYAAKYTTHNNAIFLDD